MVYTKTGAGAGPTVGYIAVGRTGSVSASGLSLLTYRKNALVPREISSPFISSDVEFCSWGTSSYLFVAFSLYTRTGNTFTNTSNISLSGSQPNNNISSDGNYAAACTGTLGRSAIYFNNAGTLTNVSLVSESSSACAVSSDGTYVAFLRTGGSSPYLTIRQRSGSGASATYSTMTLASQPNSGGGNIPGGLSFSADNVYLAVSPTNQAHQTVYKFNSGNGTYEKITSPFSGTLPDSSIESCCFNQQGDLLAIATNAKTFIYERSADVFTYTATLTGGYSGNFHPGGNWYVTGSGQIFRKNSPSSWTAVGSRLHTSPTLGACKFSPFIV